MSLKPPSTPRFPVNWDLESLFPHPSTEAFRGLVSTYEAGLEALTADVQSLPRAAIKTAEQWGEALERFSELRISGLSLRSFIGCHAAADAENPLYQQFEGKFAAVSPALTSLELLFETAFGALDDAERSAFVAADARLQESAFYVNEAAASAAYRLPGDLERLYADLAVDGLKGWSRLYDRLSGSLRIRVMEKGEIVLKSPGQVQFDMPDRSRRENNFYAANFAWAGIAETCADALNHIAGSRLAKYERLGVDHLAYPLHLNRLSRQTLETMFTVIHERAELLVPYMQEKAKWFGVDRMAWYDAAAPLPLRVESAEMTWQDASKTVVETLSEFSPKFGAFSHNAISDGWVEGEDRPGKRQGGFCTDLPAAKQSRIFMTFTGSANSMSVLAHELGHAYHTYLIRDEPPLLQNYPMNLAETASTFAEAVVGQRRLTDCQTEAEKLDILDQQCGDGLSFLMNLRCRFLFEDRFYEQRAGGELTVADLCELMESAQTDAFKGALDPSGLNPMFWVSKLHFYIDDWPFYNFPYTFGYLLSLGLFAEGRATDTAGNFPERFDHFLTLTGRMSSEDAVQAGFGYDLRERAFWDLAVDEVARRIDAFMQLSPGVRAAR